MFAHRRTQRLQTRTASRHDGARLRRLATVIAVGMCGLLASVAAVPAAFARVQPPSPADAPVPATIVRVVNDGGMAGWQITLIAIGAALLAAAVAVFLDRTVTAHRPTAGPAT